MRRSWKTVVTIIALSFCIYPDTDTRTVTAEFERCHANMERFERDLRRFNEMVDRCKTSLSARTPDTRNKHTRELTALENRREYFHNRYERSRSQSEKVRGDLKNIGGPVCPSCVQSGVNMFCRAVESLQNELDDYVSRVADLQHRLGGTQEQKDPPVVAKRRNSDFRRQRAAADSLFHSLAACANPAASILSTQAHAAINRADSLNKCNQAAALTSLDIANTLLQKAADRCGEAQ